MDDERRAMECSLCIWPELHGRFFLASCSSDMPHEMGPHFQEFKEVFIVSNANKFKYFDRWATAHDFPIANLINDGTTTVEGRMGGLAAVELALRIKQIDADCAVISGDMLFSEGFDLSGVTRFFRSYEGELAVYYEVCADSGLIEDTCCCCCNLHGPSSSAMLLPGLSRNQAGHTVDALHYCVTLEQTSVSLP